MDRPSKFYRELAEIAKPRKQERLGDLAIREGFISHSQLDECVKEQRNTNPSHRPRIGELLIRKGFLKPGQLALLLEQQADEAGFHDPGWRYEIRDLLGRGGTASVYLGWDRELRREVAIKVIRREHMENVEILKRMTHEARIAAGLNHSNIVPVYDVGNREGLVYFVMQWVRGKTLAQRLAEEKNPPHKIWIPFLVDVALAVHYAHQKGVIHRDLKPANLMVDDKGNPQVMDFGLAHLSGSDSIHTKTGSILGTPVFMAPEQVMGETQQINHRSDTYALGAILFQILTSHPPYAGQVTAKIYHDIVKSPSPSPREELPEVDLDLDIICRKAMAKDPDARYASANAFAEDLKRYLAGEPIKARAPTVTYRLRRTISRHPIQTSILTVSMLFTITALFLSLVLWQEFQTQRKKYNRPVVPAYRFLDRLSMIRSQAAMIQNDFRAGRLSREQASPQINQLMEEVQTMHKKAPQMIQIYYIRAQLQLLQFDSPGAKQSLQEALSLDPNCSQVWALLSFLLIEQKYQTQFWTSEPLSLSPEIRTALQQAVRRNPSPWSLRPNAQERVLKTLTFARHTFWVLEDRPRAEEILRKGDRRYRSEVYLLELGRWEVPAQKAQRYYLNSLARAPSYIPALLEYAYRFRDSENSEESMHSIKTAIQFFSTYAPTLALRGILYLSRGEKANAMQDLKDAIREDPNLVTALKPYLEKATESR